MTQYSTDYLATRATDFIQRATQDADPFFLYVAPTAPHAPFVPEPSYASAPDSALQHDYVISQVPRGRSQRQADE